MGLLLIAFDTRWIVGRRSYFSLWRERWLNGIIPIMDIPMEPKFIENYTVS